MDYWNNPMLMEKLRRMYSEPSYTSTKPFNPILGEDSPLASEQLMTQPGTMPKKTGMGWMDYLGLGTMAAAPVANALLNKEPVRPPGFVGGQSVGIKPIIQVNPNIYPQQQRMPAFLARLLMGAR